MWHVHGASDIRRPQCETTESHCGHAHGKAKKLSAELQEKLSMSYKKKKLSVHV